MGIHNLPDLSPEVMSLVNGGVYSLYTIRSGGPAVYVLVTNTGEFYLLSSTGRVVIDPRFKILTDIPKIESVTFPDIAPPMSAIKVNYA